MPDAIKMLKDKYQNSTRSEQIQILTIFFCCMILRSSMEKFQFSQKATVLTRRLTKERRLFAMQSPKRGKIMQAEVEIEIKSGCIMPGKMDFVSVKTATGKEALCPKQSEKDITKISNRKSRNENWIFQVCNAASI